MLTKLCLVHPDKHILTHFSTVATGSDVFKYEIVKDLYKLEFVADGQVHVMTIEDVLIVLPKTWYGRQARTYQARIIHSLARAAHAALILK